MHLNSMYASPQLDESKFAPSERQRNTSMLNRARATGFVRVFIAQTNVIVETVVV